MVYLKHDIKQRYTILVGNPRYSVRAYLVHAKSFMFINKCIDPLVKRFADTTLPAQMCECVRVQVFVCVFVCVCVCGGQVVGALCSYEIIDLFVKRFA